jgi:hypothetical protein
VERKRVLIHFSPLFFWHLLPVFLYAETHYRFRYFFSFLHKREPEIIADAPHRIEPNLPLPLLILVKDAHIFPTTLNQITVVIQSNKNVIREQKLLESPVAITEKLWWRVYKIPLEGLTDIIECNVRFEIDNGKRQRIYNNDNHLSSSHHPLRAFVSSSPLPRFENLHFGECHSHSSYTDDQVEFGSPLEASAQLSRSLGLSFLCATDHSYDLDDTIDNYLVNDTKISKWHSFQKEVDELNSKSDDFVIVRGEEVSCRSSSDQNIHLLLLGNRKFYPGSGDGAEQWLKTRSELSLNDILEDVELTGIPFAAHPRDPVSFLQRLLLHRGKWHIHDLRHNKLSGIQFINGKISKGFWNGYRQWVEALLQGRQIFIIAGNDAHGNFNRFRQIGIPFLKIHESDNQLFGKMRTGIFLESLTEKNILQSIQTGKTIVTDGPVINLQVINSGHTISSIGQRFMGNKHSAILEVRSSTEFGSINSLKLFVGRIGQREKILFSERPLMTYKISKKFTIDSEKDTYIRAEVWTSSSDSYDGHSHFCLTNPIWFTPN